jgi:hypothetical protein
VNARLQARLMREHIHCATPGGIQPRRRSPLFLLFAGAAFGFAAGFLIFGALQ